MKVLSSARANDPDAAALFMDEARLVGMLSHANLAGVFEVAADDGVHFLAMEYVHGAISGRLLGAAQKAKTAVPFEARAIDRGGGRRRAGPRAPPMRRAMAKPLRLVHRDISL